MHSVYEGFIARDEQLLSSKMQNATINSLRIYSWDSIVWAKKKLCMVIKDQLEIWL